MINLVDICKEYNEKKVLQNLNFSFKDSECYFIKGASGVGKTTLLNVIYRYEHINSGYISLGKKDIRMEYMFQEPLLFRNLSVRDNLVIKYGALNKEISMDEEVLIDVLQKVELNTNLDVMVHTLSGGEMQRLQFAQYMLSNPDVLLLDEPVCKLNPELRKKIYQLLDEIFGDKLKIIVTHDEEILQSEGIYLEMRDGKLWRNN